MNGVQGPLDSDPDHDIHRIGGIELGLIRCLQGRRILKKGFVLDGLFIPGVIWIGNRCCPG